MRLGDLFESLAAWTWQRLADAERLRVSQGETTLTDHLLLEMARCRHPSLRVYKTPITEEDTKGTDWEWWIGTPVSGWLRYAAQAKRVTVSSGRYDQLAHTVGNWKQLDILRRYSSANAAIPVYCLYNNTTRATARHWHCSRPFDEPQLGCSIAPIAVVERALNTRGGRTFEQIHQDSRVIPWRCLVRCPSFIGSFVSNDPNIPKLAKGDLQKIFGVEPRVYDALPSYLNHGEADSRLAEFPSDRESEPYFDTDFYSLEAGIFPRRIAVINVSESDDLISLRRSH